VEAPAAPSPRAALLLCPSAARGKASALAKCAGRRAVGVFHGWALLGAMPLEGSAAESRKVSVLLPVWSLVCKQFSSFELHFDTDLISV